jgi:hypothetical protein
MTRKGDWMQTYTGRQFWPIDPRADEIDIVDIAHALSQQCRFAGHCKTFYSVAEHSWRTSNVCNSENALWGLLHDASEAYLVDLPTPVKHASEMGSAYQVIEDRLMKVIADRFDLPWPMPEDVKKTDAFMLHWEQRDLMAPPPAPWAGQGSVLLPKTKLEPLHPVIAEYLFLKRFCELSLNPGLSVLRLSDLAAYLKK